MYMNTYFNIGLWLVGYNFVQNEPPTLGWEFDANSCFTFQKLEKLLQEFWKKTRNDIKTKPNWPFIFNVPTGRQSCLRSI